MDANEVAAASLTQLLDRREWLKARLPELHRDGGRSYMAWAFVALLCAGAVAATLAKAWFVGLLILGVAVWTISERISRDRNNRSLIDSYNKELADVTHRIDTMGGSATRG